MKTPFSTICGIGLMALVVGACASSKSSSSSATTAAVTTAAPSTAAPTTAAVTTAAPSSSTTTAGGAPAQTITVTPDTGLTDGQVVHIVAKGYTPGKSYGVTECADKGQATGAGDCDVPGMKVATADSAGTVTIDFPVAKGPFGNNIVCSASQACLVSVATAFSSSPSEVASMDITFAG